MTDHKYTDEQIIEALQIHMPHDRLCREAYYLINRKKAELDLAKQTIIALTEERMKLLDAAGELIKTEEIKNE